MIRFIKKILIFFIFITPLYATEFSAIKDIKVNGLQRVSYETVLSYGDLSVESVYSENLSNNAIKKLYDTQLFSDISINFLNNILTQGVV